MESLGRASRDRTQRGLSPEVGMCLACSKSPLWLGLSDSTASKERNQRSEAGGWGGEGLFGSHSEGHESHGRIVSTCMR